MSFILDALRKSEHARERRALPGPVDLPGARATRSRLPWALGAVALLLAINIGVLLFVLWRPATPPSTPSDAAPAATTSAAAARELPPPIGRPPLVRQLAGEVAPADPGLDVPDPAATRRLPTEPAPAAGAPLAIAGNTEAGVPTLHELPTSVAAALPALHLDLHVFSDDRAQRFVIVNGQRLREGGQLREGLAVVRITPLGAILDYRGNRFLLPRE